MNLAVEHLDAETAVVSLGVDPLGRLAEDVRATIETLLASGVSRVIVEFAAPHLLNSKLLDALVRATARQDPSRGGIAVVASHDYVRQILEVSETGGVVLLAESREDALEALPAAG